MNSVEDELENLDEKIKDLQQKKKELMKQKGFVYCYKCQKFYENDKCKHKSEFSMGGAFLEAYYITCPKGHTWDDK